MANRRHKRTEKSVTEIVAYATVGVPHHDIALLSKISIKTLLKHYDDELKEGKARGNAAVTRTLFAAAQRGEAWAVCFWLKCQAGWRETHVLQTQSLDKHGNPTDVPKLGISFDDGGPGMALKLAAVNNEQRTIGYDEQFQASVVPDIANQ